MKTNLENRSHLYALPTAAVHDSDLASRTGTQEVGPGTLKEAYAYCKGFAEDRSENFRVASKFVPTELQDHVWAVYAFARHADDFADEPGYEGERLEALDRWEEMLEQAYRRQADHRVFRALGNTVRTFDIPINDLKALLTAYRVDLHSRGVNTYRELARYCGLSAAPIGRVGLYLHGHREATLHRFSDDMCAGVQIATQLKNLAKDLQRGRCYLPVEDLMHFGVCLQDLEAGVEDASFRDLMRFSTSRARTLLTRGQPIVRRVDPNLGAELQATLLGATRILDSIEDRNFEVLGNTLGRASVNLTEVSTLAAFSFGPRFFHSNPRRSS